MSRLELLRAAHSYPDDMLVLHHPRGNNIWVHEYWLDSRRILLHRKVTRRAG